MVRQRGIGNKNGFVIFNNSLSTSGLLRSTTIGSNNFRYDVNGPVVHMQKEFGDVPGEGRLTFSAGNLYIPSYTTSIGTSVGSGFTAPSDGVYQVTGSVAVSGNAVQPVMFGSVVTVDNIPASGTESFASGGADVSTAVPVHGIVHVAANQVINVGVRRVHGGTLISIGAEDMGHVIPAATITIVKLGSDEPTFNT